MTRKTAEHCRETQPVSGEPRPVEKSETSKTGTLEEIHHEADSFEQTINEEVVCTEASTGSWLSTERVQALAQSFNLPQKLRRLGQRLDRITQRAIQQISDNTPKSSLKTGELYWPPTKMRRADDLPTDRRFNAKREVAETVQYMREGLAQMETAVIQFIRQSPDASREQIMEVVDVYANKYGLKNESANTHHYNLIEYAVTSYLTKHRAVADMRKSVQSDNELYFTLFGAAPKGRVEIAQGPMTLHVRCDNLEDYTRVYYRHFKKEQGPTEAEMAVADSTGGCSIPTALQPELAGCITAEKALNQNFEKRNTGLGKEIYIHEEQHAMKRLFEEIWSTHVTRPNMWHEALVKNYENDAAAVEVYLKSYFRYRRGLDAEKRAGDEILAYVAGMVQSADNRYEKGKPLLHQYESEGPIKFPYYTQASMDQITASISNRLNASHAEGGSYDYTYETRNSLVHTLVKDFKLPETKATQLMESTFREEHKKLIDKGLAACVKLLDNGYSLQDVLSRFNHIPLHRWPKQARQTLKQKDKGHTRSSY